MWPFRSAPTPFAAAFLGGSLIHEAIQRKKADKYAAQVVREYKPGESPYSSPKIGTLQDVLESLDDLLNDE